jgi:hypothetical protein
VLQQDPHNFRIYQPAYGRPQWSPWRLKSCTITRCVHIRAVVEEHFHSLDVITVDGHI